MEIINLILVKYSLNKISKEANKKLVKCEESINTKTHRNIKLSVNDNKISIEDQNKIIYHQTQCGYILYNGTAITNLEDSKFAITNKEKKQIISYLPEDKIFQLLCSQELTQSLTIYNEALEQYNKILEKDYHGKKGKELIKKAPNKLKTSICNIVIK